MVHGDGAGAGAPRRSSTPQDRALALAVEDEQQVADVVQAYQSREGLGVKSRVNIFPEEAGHCSEPGR
jgi:hypothetical protein